MQDQVAPPERKFVPKLGSKVPTRGLVTTSQFVTRGVTKLCCTTTVYGMM